MSFLRRNKITILFMLLLPLPLLLLLLYKLPANNITDLWTKSDNRTSIILGVLSSFIYEAIVIWWHAIQRWLKAVLLHGRSVEDENKRVDQERLYLENIIASLRNQLPWEVDKYTDLDVLQDLEQVHRVKPRLWQVPESQETYIESNLGPKINVRHFLQREKKPIMLKGEPGTGKTLTVRRFTVDEAEHALTNLPGEVKIPIYIFLGFYTKHTPTGEPEPVYDFLQHYLQDQFPAADFLREQLREYLKQGRLILIFDGLNELQPDEYSARYEKLEKFILHDYPRNKAIFTCRTIRHTSSQFITVAMSDLDNRQIKRFIQVYLGEKDAEELYQQLISGDGFMLRVCRNPFMLHMLVSPETTKSTPQSPEQLFKEYIQYKLDEALKNFQSSYNIDQTTEILCDIGFTMQKNGLFAGVVTEEWLSDNILSNVPLEQHLVLAQRADLVDYTPKVSLRFYHQILQEYFAAVAIKKEWEEGKSLEAYFVDYRWEETVLVCASIIPDSEKFIRQIWSPGKVSPEAHWLAMKAVGISGNRVSADYYGALMNEAEKKLSLTEESPISGYSKTVLKADTVKALSYIDDERTAALLSSTLTKHEGWIRELCIQVLGSSRNPIAHQKLRLEVVKLRSVRDLLLAAPYFDRRELLLVVANSAVSIDLMLQAFWKIWQWLWILIPVAFFDLLYAGANFLNLDPIVLTGRLLSITFFITVVRFNFPIIFRTIRSRSSLFTTLFDLKSPLTWYNTILVVLIPSLWFFSNELLTCFVILQFLLIYILGIYIIFNFFRSIPNLPRLASFLYAPFKGRWALYFTLGISLVVISNRFFPSIRQVPSSMKIHNTVSGTAIVLYHIYLFILSPYVLLPFGAFITIIGFLSAIVHLITFSAYWRLRRYRNASAYGNRKQALQRIMKVVLNPNGWPQIRKKAIKDIRLIDLPTHNIEDLDILIESENDLDVRRELERTVYELRSRSREKNRETSNNKYPSTIARQGETYRRMGRYQEALDDLNQAIALYNGYTWAIARRGETYRQMGRYQEALADLERAISLNDKDAWTIARQGETYLQMGHYPEALKDFNQAIALDDKNAWALAGRWETYRKMGRFQKQNRNHKKYASALADQGETHYQQSDYQEALEYLNRALILDESNIRVLTFRGKTYRQMQRYQEALADFDRALALDAKYVQAIAHRGITYRRMERYQEALADFDRALTLDDKDEWAIALRGETYRQMRRFPEALAEFNRALTLDAKYVQAIARRGETYRQMQRYQEALADFDRALALDDKDAWAIAHRGETYRWMERYQEAQADLDRAISLNEKEDRYLYQRALIRLQVGQTSAFKSDLQAAIRLVQAHLKNSTDNQHNRFNLALYKFVDGNLVEAESEYKHLASACSSLALFQGAVVDLEDFLKIQPSNSNARNILAHLQSCISKLKQSPTS